MVPPSVTHFKKPVTIISASFALSNPFLQSMASRVCMEKTAGDRRVAIWETKDRGDIVSSKDLNLI